MKFLFLKLGISNRDIALIRSLGLAKLKSNIPMLTKLRSQLGQDLFVLSHTNYKKEGYFVEIGATNGLDLSNTYLLETEYSWSGILVEPARVWEKHLKANRPNASISTLCVWKDSSQSLTFHEADVPELSTIDLFTHKDGTRD